MTPFRKRANDGDGVGRAAFHLLGQVAYGAAAGEDFAGALLDGDDGGLVEHQAFADQTDQRVGRAEVNGQIATEVMKQVLEHPCSPRGQRLVQGPKNTAEATREVGWVGIVEAAPPASLKS